MWCGKPTTDLTVLEDRKEYGVQGSMYGPVYVCPDHREAMHEYLHQPARRFWACLAMALVTAVMVIAGGVSGNAELGVGGVVLIASWIVVFPCCATPETVRWLGAARSRKLVRWLGAAILAICVPWLGHAVIG
jgi:multisubunit Na+/H+ antiporter MnhB subunit